MQKGIIDLNGFTFTEVNNANTEIVSAAANTNGVLLTMAGIHGGSGESASITQGGDIILEAEAISGLSFRDSLKDTIFIPAGNALFYTASSGSTTKAYGYHKVL